MTRTALPAPPTTAAIIKNTPFWPDVDLSTFCRALAPAVRVTPGTLKPMLLTAISEVNAELYGFRVQQQQQGYHALSQVPVMPPGGRGRRVGHYHQAIYCWLRAALSERLPDGSTAAVSSRHEQARAEACGRLWRDVQRAISRVQDAPYPTGESNR